MLLLLLLPRGELLLQRLLPYLAPWLLPRRILTEATWLLLLLHVLLLQALLL